jgi:hypothetical protein
MSLAGKNLSLRRIHLSPPPLPLVVAGRFGLAVRAIAFLDVPSPSPETLLVPCVSISIPRSLYLTHTLDLPFLCRTGCHLLYSIDARVVPITCNTIVLYLSNLPLPPSLVQLAIRY